jgi:carbonic anhydrase
MDKFYQSLLQNNKKWVDEQLALNPHYFEDMAKGQNPPILWIGCADSRVPASQITGTKPGEIFEHRNIANMIVHSDMNMLSVLDFGVNMLEVSHVIVCGHYGCGGILAAMSNKQFGLIDNWLRDIKDVYRMHHLELDAIEDTKDRANRFVELNVIEQVFDLCKTSIIQNAWKKRKGPIVHGWVYDMYSGLIKDLDGSVSDDSQLEAIFKFEHSLISKRDDVK